MTDTDLKSFAARTQAKIVTQLLVLFGVLMFALLAVSVVPRLHVDDKVLAILDRIVTALLPIVTLSVGFWMNRHRDTTLDQPETPTTPADPAQPKVN